MITTRTNHQFDWLTVHPDSWPKQYAQLHQKCGTCDREILGELSTNARGSWEHFKCAETAYYRHYAAGELKMGTREQFLTALYEYEGFVLANHDHRHPRGTHFHWRAL